MAARCCLNKPQQCTWPGQRLRLHYSHHRSSSNPGSRGRILYARYEAHDAGTTAVRNSMRRGWRRGGDAPTPRAARTPPPRSPARHAPTRPAPVRLLANQSTTRCWCWCWCCGVCACVLLLVAWCARARVSRSDVCGFRRGVCGWVAAVAESAPFVRAQHRCSTCSSTRWVTDGPSQGCKVLPLVCKN